MDGYSVVVDVQSRQRKDAQADETRLAFESLVHALAGVPALLSHNVEMLVGPSTGSRHPHLRPRHHPR